jgi:Bacterial PH domain
VGEFDRRAVARLAPYRLPEERMRVAMQEHWAAKIEPVLTTVVTLVMVIAIGSMMPTRLGRLADVAWWLWFVLLARLGWTLCSWHVSWFIATNKRLILIYGLVTRKVAMMPLSKVTDMSYARSPLGQLLGYGTFTLESAGQDQALQRISFVRDPDSTYRTICQEIFGDQPAPLAEWGDDDSDDGDDDGPGGPDGPRRPDHDPHGTDLPVQRLGAYLLPQDRSSFGRRWIRRRRARPGDLPPGMLDEAPAFDVSREHASTYERVPRSTEGWWD